MYQNLMLWSGIIGYSSFKLINSDFDLNDDEIKDILDKSKKITTKKEILDEIKGKNIKPDLPIILVIDNKDHGLGSYGIIKNTLNNKNIKFEQFFISKILEPYSIEEKENILKNNEIEYNKENLLEQFSYLKDNNEFKVYETLNEISKSYKNNPIIVNMSYAYNFFNQETKKETNFYLNEDRSNLLFKRETIDKINLIKEENFKLIKTLYDNPNLHISKSAGNNLIYSEINKKYYKDILHELILSYSKNDLNKYEKIKFLLLDLITKNKEFSNEIISKFNNDFQNITNIKLENKEIENFISLSLLDYLVNYESLNLVEQLEFLKENKKIDLNEQIIVAQGMSYNTLLNNYEKFKSNLNLKNEVYQKIEHDYLNNFFNKHLIESNNLKNIYKMKNYLDDLKSINSIILDNTTYGNVLNPYNKSSFYNIGPINHDLKYLEIYNGTSSAAPQILSFEVISKVLNKDFENFSIEYKKENLKYDYLNTKFIPIEQNIEKHYINKDLEDILFNFN